MGYCDLSTRIRDLVRLSIHHIGRTGCGITAVADSKMTCQTIHRIFFKDFTNQSLPLVKQKILAIARTNSGCFFTAMLPYLYPYDDSKETADLGAGVYMRVRF